MGTSPSSYMGLQCIGSMYDGLQRLGPDGTQIEVGIDVLLELADERAELDVSVNAQQHGVCSYMLSPRTT